MDESGNGAHKHHWIMPRAISFTSPASCECGASRVFVNYLPDYSVPAVMRLNRIPRALRSLAQPGGPT